MSTDTQLEAFLSSREKAASLREAIWQNLRDYGAATGWQLALRMGFQHRQDVAPRLTELKKAGRIRDTRIRRIDERTGQAGIVWAATEAV